MVKLSGSIITFSNGKVALAAMLLFLAFTAVVLPQQSAQSEAYTEEVGSPDQSLFYTPDDLYQVAETYGSEGRSMYIRARFTFDLVWPLVYVFFLGTGLGWLGGKLFSQDSRLQMLTLLPLFGGLFDYLENIATSIVMARYPQSANLAAAMAPLMTLFKWSCIALSFVAGSILIVKFGLSRFLRSKE